MHITKLAFSVVTMIITEAELKEKLVDVHNRERKRKIFTRLPTHLHNHYTNIFHSLNDGRLQTCLVPTHKTTAFSKWEMICL